jgi:putative phage-type endonuclease
MRVLVETKGMDRDQWIWHRKQGIGGSDAAAIAGVHKYKSPLVLYMEKVGLYEQKVENEAALWGNLLEDTVAKEFIRRYNEALSDEFESQGINMYNLAKIQRRNAILQHDEYDFMLMNVDRFMSCPVKGRGILEVKTASVRVADEWKGEDVPNAYFVQVQHYLAITGLDYAYMAVLIGGQEMRYYYIPRDQEFIDDLIEIEKRFWYENVLASNPPEVDGSDSTTEMYKILYPVHRDRYVLELPSTGIDLILQREHYREMMDHAEENKKRCENSLKDMMKEAEEANAGPHKVTWKTAKNGVRSMKFKIGK